MGKLRSTSFHYVSMFGAMHLGLITTQKKEFQQYNFLYIYLPVNIKMMFRISFISQVCVHKEFDCAEKNLVRV